MRSRVDLPQPLGPTSETNSPAPTDSEMPARASTGPLAASYVMPTRSRPISSLVHAAIGFYFGISTLVKKSVV